MVKQKIKVFEATYKEDLEKHVNDWLNNKNNKDIKVLNISISNRNQYGGYIAVAHYEYEENFFSEITSKRIPIEYFFENSENKKLCIHCDTVEKAKKFTEALRKFKNSKEPLSCEQIKNLNCYWTEFWDNFKEETCYELNGYCYKEWYLKNGYTIYEFEEVIF